MRTIEYAPEKLNRSERPYLVANGAINYHGDVIDTSRENVENEGFKMCIGIFDSRKNSTIDDFIDKFEIDSDADSNPDFLGNYHAVLAGEQNEWKIIAFQPTVTGLRIYIANKRLYETYQNELSNIDCEPLNFLETVVLSYKKVGFTQLEFKLEQSDSSGAEEYLVELNAGHVQITEYWPPIKLELTFTGEKSKNPLESDQMYVQKTVHIS